MIRKIYFIFILCFCFSNSRSQVWNDVDGGVGPGGGFISDMVVFNSDLIIGGTFFTVSGGNVQSEGFAIWDSSVWISGNSTFDGFPEKLGIFNGELYSVGDFTKVNGNDSCERVAKWNGSNWTPLLAGINNGQALCLQEYNGDLFVGGRFTQVDNTITARRIARWDGNQWYPMGTGFTGGLTEVLSMAVYNSELYVGGYFSTIDGTIAENICKWNGTNWSPIGLGANGGVRTMFVDTLNNKLYIGGDFTQIDTVSAPATVACFDGTVWTAIGNGPALYCRALEIYNNKLIAAGGSYGLVNSLGDTIKEIAWYDGAEWLPLCYQLDPVGTLYSLKTYNNELYTGGFIDTIDGTLVHHIARLHNPTLAFNEIQNDFIVLYPNPSQSLLTVDYTVSVDSKKIVAEIHNMIGNIYYFKELDLHKQSITLDLSKFPLGVYYFTLTVDHTTCYKKKFLVIR